jgi:hypothetical protein
MFADGPLFLSLSLVFDFPTESFVKKLNQPKQGDLSRISHQGIRREGKTPSLPVLIKTIKFD